VYLDTRRLLDINWIDAIVKVDLYKSDNLKPWI